MTNEYRVSLNKALSVFFLSAMKIVLKNPGQVFSFLKTMRWMRRAARLRAYWAEQNIQIPPIIIFSVTNQCNLQCKGCYAQSFHREVTEELSEEELRRITEEAKGLGVSFFVIAGGEPLMRPDFVDIMEASPELIYLVFTNGLLIDNKMIRRLKSSRNIVPLISLEGSEDDTDNRRGAGTYTKLLQTMKTMKEEGLFFGNSFTLTRSNYDTMMDHSFTRALVDEGCRFFIYLEYTPTVEGTEDWILTQEQRSGVRTRLEEFRKKYASLFIAVPWDEDDVGGCLSAARGFVHINASGDLEPCPFAPFSDVNVKEHSLKEAFQSELLRKIRQRPELAKENGGGCILWKERELVQSLLSTD